MAVDAEELLIRPFRDVVVVATAALANASATHVSPGPEDHVTPMSRAAQALLREGKRALRKVQLVWNVQVRQYGDSFRHTIVQQDSVNKRRLQLEEVLWDFEDYIDPDEFDQERYSTLQAATKALAVDLIDTTKRLKLDPAVLHGKPAGTFPPLPPLPAGRNSRPPSARSPQQWGASRPSTIREEAAESHSLRPDKLLQSVTRSEPARNHSVAALAPYQQLRHAPSIDALTPPASPREGPVLTNFNTTVLPKVTDLAPSPAPSETRASIAPNASRASSAILESLDHLAIADNSPDRRLSEPENTVSPTQELVRESRGTTEGRKSRPANPRIPDCKIQEDSTYCKLNGFCKGAMKFQRDSDWGSIKATTVHESGVVSGAGDAGRASDGVLIAFHSAKTKVGACDECGYAHCWDDIKGDRKNKPNAVRTSDSGARYRLRLLFKSHLRQSSSGEVFYGCLWCVCAAHTVREGDATVFRSANDLLRHLTRHPQPLAPVIPGVEVRYGSLPDSASQEFDLHLPDPPLPVPMPDKVARLATATAIRDHYRRPGRPKLDRPPKYDGEMLGFMEGARIVGVMFPEPWEGKWALGRADGNFQIAAFPTKAVELRPPQESEIPAGGENGMVVTARWKWQPPSADGAPWLSFGKGEVISNVQCLYADYWCWSGTNSKGKTGVFPQSFIDLQTLRAPGSPVSAKPSRGRTLFGYRSTSSPEILGANSSKRNSLAL